MSLFLTRLSSRQSLRHRRNRLSASSRKDRYSRVLSRISHPMVYSLTLEVLTDSSISQTFHGAA